MVSRSIAQWHEIAVEVVLSVLEAHDAVTHRELEARAADYTWDPHICPSPVQPHHLTAAVQTLVQNGVVEITREQTRGGLFVNTISLSRNHRPRGRERIKAAAGRKRLLTARHQGWSTRGPGSGLIGQAGENAMAAALRDAGQFAQIRTNVRTLLDVTLIGEIDMSCIHVTESRDGITPVLVPIEVKNTREWYYDGEAINEGGAVARFLRKVAHLQAQLPGVAIAPLFVARKSHYTLIQLGEEHGFLVASTVSQLVQSDSDLSIENFQQVRDELYPDLQLDRPTTNYHRGIAAKMIPKNVLAASHKWRQNYTQYMHPDDN